MHHDSMLIKRSNSMQQYADIYSLPRHSTCFGCHATIIRSTKNCICYLWCTSWEWYRYFLPPWPKPDWCERVLWNVLITPVRIRPRRKEVTVPLPWRTPEVADTVFSTPDDGCMTHETCRVTWQRINVYILSHRVGPLLTLHNSHYRNVPTDPRELVADPFGSSQHTLRTAVLLRSVKSFKHR